MAVWLPAAPVVSRAFDLGSPSSPCPVPPWWDPCPCLVSLARIPTLAGNACPWWLTVRRLARGLRPRLTRVAADWSIPVPPLFSCQCALGLAVPALSGPRHLPSPVLAVPPSGCRIALPPDRCTSFGCSPITLSLRHPPCPLLALLGWVGCCPHPACPLGHLLLGGEGRNVGVPRPPLPHPVFRPRPLIGRDILDAHCPALYPDCPTRGPAVVPREPGRLGCLPAAANTWPHCLRSSHCWHFCHCLSPLHRADCPAVPARPTPHFIERGERTAETRPQPPTREARPPGEEREQPPDRGHRAEQSRPPAPTDPIPPAANRLDRADRERTGPPHRPRLRPNRPTHRPTDRPHRNGNNNQQHAPHTPKPRAEPADPARPTRPGGAAGGPRRPPPAYRRPSGFVTLS